MEGEVPAHFQGAAEASLSKALNPQMLPHGALQKAGDSLRRISQTMDGTGSSSLPPLEKALKENKI